MYKKIIKKFNSIIDIKDSPHSIALGFAIGTFINFLPTPGLNIILCFLVVLFYDKVNKYSLFSTILIWNPFVMAPVYFGSYALGDVLFGSAPIVKYNTLIMNTLYEFSRRYLVGNLIIAMTATVIAYFLVKFIVKKVQSNLQK